MRSPPRRTSPPSGGNTPAMTLKQVVLPAPFGPIRAQISPSRTAKRTSSTARKPRKCLEMPSTSRSGAIELARFAPRTEPGRAAGRRPDAMRQEDDHREETNTVEDLLGARRLHAEGVQQIGQALGEPGEQERPQNRTEQRAVAADDRRQDQLDRPRDVENLLGKQVVVIKREEHASGARVALAATPCGHSFAE